MPYKIFVVCLPVSQHEIRHGIPIVDLLSDKEFRCAEFFCPGQFFHLQAVLADIFQVISKALCKHPELIDSVHPWPEIRLHLHGKVDIVLLRQRMDIIWIQMRHTAAQRQIDTAVACCRRSAAADVHNYIFKPFLVSADCSVY